MNVNEILFSILRAEINGEEPDERIKKSLDTETLKALYATAKKFDVLQIVSFYLSHVQLEMPPELSKYFRKALGVAVSRYERMEYDFEKICRVLEEEKIPYLPLKGSVIRELYPVGWMRTSCDIDVLVMEHMLDKAMSALSDKLSFTTDANRDFHDVSLYAESGTHLELHFNIMENMENADTLLSQVWDYAVLCDGYNFRYRMTDEFLLFHIICHTAFHVKNGGGGPRAFVDLYLLEKNLDYDKQKLSQLCNACSLDSFRESMEGLSRVWMEGGEHSEVTRALEELILGGALYASLEGGAAIKSSKHGRVGYILGLVFQPYNVLKEKYPVLKKHRWLVPVCQVRRWARLLLDGKTKDAVQFLKAGKSTAAEDKIELLKRLGIY